MKTPTVNEALRILRRAIDDEARDHIATGLHTYLKRKPMICNTLIEGCTITKLNDESPLTVSPVAMTPTLRRIAKHLGRSKKGVRYGKKK